MPRGTTKRRPRTTAALIDAAFEVFAERGFYGASIEDICDRAGLTRGAFYSNFANKEELFFRLFDSHADRVVAFWADALAGVEDSDDPLAALFEGLFQQEKDEQHWFLISAEFSLYAIRNPETAEKLAAHDRELREKITPFLRDFFKRAGRKPDVDPDLLARLLTAVHEGGMMQSLVEPAKLPLGTLERTFLEPLFTAVSHETPKRPRRSAARTARP
ncbi:TetR/AcrR family transcriptional regulator [Amycolatopsis halotolerans]|uniref:TetR/AcrR family transcriptional regulator n=1 Tax=Amycolatopsis halotolerans TaxID=330083 RepID=A0ABV7QEA0_9PSEU